MQTCIFILYVGIANGAVNILTDLMILTIPMPLVWKLKADVWRRLSLAFTFLLGSFVVFASIYRFFTIFKYIYGDITCMFPLIPPPRPSEKSKSERSGRVSEV